MRDPRAEAATSAACTRRRLPLTRRLRRVGAVNVNGSAVTPAIENGYAEITRTWTKGDRIEFELPMAPQRVRASDKIEATRGKVALRCGPLVYNIEQVDQDITKTRGRARRRSRPSGGRICSAA